MAGVAQQGDPGPSGLDELIRRLGVGVASIPTTPLRLFSLPGAVDRITRYGFGAGDPTNSVEKGYLGAADKATEWADAWDNFFRKHIGLPEGDPGLKGDTEELAGSILLNPAGGLTKIATKVGSKLATRAAKVLSAATATPETVIGKAAVVGAGTGLDAGIRQVVNGDQAPHNDEEVPTQEPAPGPDTTPPAPTNLFDTVKQALAPAAEPVVPVQNTLMAQVKAAVTKQPETSLIDQVKDIAEQHGAEIAAGLAVAGVLFHMKNGKSVAALSRELHAPKVDSLTGLNDATDVLTTPQKFRAGMVDPLDAVRPVIRDIRGKVPEETETALTLSSPASMAERTTTALRTGNVVDSDIKLGTPDIPSLAVAADATAKLDQQTRALYYSAATLRNERANIAMGLPARLETPVEEMDKVITAAENHPVVSKLLKFNDTFTKSFADLFHENGIIDSSKLEAFKSRPFLPEISSDRKTLQTKLSDFFAGVVSDDPVTDFNHLFKREGTTGKTLPPIEALEQYATAGLKFIEQNAIRRKVIGTVHGAAERGMRDYQGVITKVDGPSRRDGITIRTKGQSQHYRVHDPHLLTALRFYPEQINPLANFTRRFLQTMTTGRGAPWFSLTSMIYDSMAAAVLHPRGTKFGLYRGDVIGGTVLSAGHALGAMGAQLARATAQQLQASLAAEGTLTRIFGPQAVRRASSLMANAYARSTLAMMEKYGAGGGTLAQIDHEIRNGYTVLRKISPDFGSRFPGARKLLNVYDGILESVQNGARLAFIARNAKAGMNKTEMFRAMAGARKLTGDFSVSGASKTAKGLQSVFPYYNVTIQSMNQWAKMFKAQPFHTLFGITTAFALPTIASTYYASTLGPEYADYLWKKLTSQQRDGYMYLPLPDRPPEKGLMIPVLPEWRPFAAMIRTGMDALLGLSNGKINDELHVGMRKGVDDFFGARDRQDLTQALLSGLSPIGSLPPGINFGVAVSGGAVDPAQMRLYEQSPLRASPLDPMGGTIQNDVMSKSMSNAITALAGTAGTMLINAGRAAVLSHRHDGDFFHAIDAGAQSLDLDVKSKVPVLSTTLLGQQIRQSRNTVDSKVFYDKSGAIQNIVSGFGNDIAHTGVIGAGARAVAREGEYPTGVADPRLLKAFLLIHGVASPLSQLMAPVGQLMNKIADVNADQRTSPADKLALTNKLNKQVVEAQGKSLDFIRQYIEDPLRNLYGRDIDITKLNRGSHVEDFPVIH